MEWLDRFVTVMDTISEASLDGLGTSELAKRTMLSKGTLHRMLQEMLSHGLIIQNSQTHKYSLGVKSMVWGSQFLSGQDPVGLLREHCDLLAQRTNLYTYLCRYDSGQVYCTYTKQPSDVRNTYFVHVGQRMPLHCSAAAKSILAFQPGELVESLVLKESVELFTEYTKADIRSLQCELAEVAKTRVAFCIEEMEPGVSAMATPVFHRKGEVMASIGLIASSHYIAANREDLVRELVCIEEKASARMASAYLLTSTGRGVI